MPDPSAFDRGAMLALLERGRGGIVKYTPNYKGFSVEIRPSKWKKKIWVGKLGTTERAQYVADAVYHYLGMSPVHFEEGVMTLPTITCIGTVIGTPVELLTQEMCASYVSQIAKGEDFGPQRDDFILKVKKVVKDPDFPVLAPPRVVRNPDFPILAPPRTELIVLDDDDRDREDEFVFDEDAAKALQMSSHSGSSGVSVAVVQTHVAGPDSVGGSEAVKAYVPIFGFDSENILQSAEQCFNAMVFSMDDCPTTSSEGEKIWMELIEELDKSSAVGASTPSVVFSDCEVCRDGYETSPILNIPRSIVRPCASTSSKFFGTPGERAVLGRTTLGSSSDWPSSQSAMNSKRQKIGD